MHTMWPQEPYYTWSHRLEPRKQGKEEQDNGVYTCFSTTTSFMDGAVSVGHAGTNSFIDCPRILIDTGALVPFGIAISEQFFCQHLRGNLNKVSPLNTTMQSVGEVKIRILEQVKREPLSSWLGQLTTWPFQGNKCFCSSQPCWSHQYPTSQQV